MYVLWTRVSLCLYLWMIHVSLYFTPPKTTHTHTQEDDTCCFDWGLLVEPVTLLCGHTFCRHCVGIMLDDAAAKVGEEIGRGGYC